MTLAAVMALERLATSSRPTSSQVEANRHQLEDLTTRLQVHTRGGLPGRQLLLTFANRCGSFLGVVADPSREARLWFTVDGRPGLFPNPTRRELPTVLLARHELGTSLVRRGEGVRIAVSLIGDQDLRSSSPETVGTVDNVRGGWVADSVFGWGLGTVTASPHCNFSARDLRAFLLLARLLDVRACKETAERGCLDTTVWLWREAVPDRLGFRVQVDGGGEVEGSMELRYRSGRASTPSSARWVLQQVALEVPLVLSLQPPVPDRVGPRPTIVAGPDTVLPLSIEMSFDTLLEGTAWHDQE